MGGLTQIVGHAQRLGKVGLVIWKPKRAHDDNALVILRYADWPELHGSRGLPDDAKGGA